MPATGLRVRAVPLDASGGEASAWIATDPRGRFRLEGLRLQAYRLVAKLGPLASEVEVAASVVPGAPPADYPIQLAGGFPQRPPGPMDAGAKGRVRIVGHDGGEVNRAQVAMQMQVGFGGYLDMAEGVFVRPALEPWDATYVITVPVDAGGRPLPYGPGVATFSDAGEGEVLVRLPAERVVEGRLLDADGNGLAGLEILAGPRGSVTLPHATARTGGQGEFRLGNLGEGTYVLQTRVPSGLLASGDWAVTTLPEGVARVDLHLRAGISVTLRVLGTRNDPIGQAVVKARKPGAPVPAPNDPTAFAALQTDADGRVTLEGLDPDGAYVLSVTPPQGRSDLQVLRREGWKPASGDVVLEQGYIVTGVVQDARGAPARAFVHVKQPDGTFRPSVATRPDGRFTIPGLPSGPLTLAASAGPGPPTGPEVKAEAGAANLVLLVEAPR